MLTFIINNWGKLTIAAFMTFLIAAYMYKDNQNASLEATKVLLTEQNGLQKQIIIQQKQQYNSLVEQNKINESSLNQYLIASENYKGALKDAQKEIVKLKDQLDNPNNNRITKQWMRVATGNNAASVSAIPTSASSVNGKIESQESIRPSAAAASIAEFVSDCYQLQNKHNILIDNIYSTVNNYNNNLNNNMLK